MTGRTSNEIRAARRSARFPVPTPAVLAADVAAIIANPTLVDGIVRCIRAEGADLSSNAVMAVLQSRLLDVWTNRVDEAHRYVWRRWYELDGQRRSSRQDLSAALGLEIRAPKRYETEVFAQLADAMWPTHEFDGLSVSATRLLVEGMGIRRVQDLHMLKAFPVWESNRKALLRQELDEWLRERNLQPPKMDAAPAEAPAHEFDGLSPRTMRLLVVRLRLTRVDELYERLTEIATHYGFRTAIIRDLDAWLEARGRLPLAPLLDRSRLSNAENFPGLPDELLRLLGRAGIPNVPMVYIRLDALILAIDFDIGSFRQLSAWLQANRHPSLEPYLTDRHRRKLDPYQHVWPR